MQFAGIPEHPGGHKVGIIGSERKIGIGLYGLNGHQVHHLVTVHPRAQLVAFSGFPKERLGSILAGAIQADGVSAIHPEAINGDGVSAIHEYASLEEMLSDSRVELVSLCSSRRSEQAADAIRCLKAGKHVYAEKPCALSESELDLVLRTSVASGCEFHEMAGTAFEEPWLTMRKIVQQGEIGDVVQVFCQKSYPLGNKRPQDEGVDGGLLCQVGIHAFRFVEHVACRSIIQVEARQTRLGNGDVGGDGQLHTAASYLLQLEGGGIASVIANYLNPPAFGTWGNEHVRIFGTNGFVEATDGGSKTRLVLNDRDCGSLDLDIREEVPGAGKRYFDAYINKLLGLGEMPLSLEEELHPLRMVLRAEKSAKRAEEHDAILMDSFRRE